jgi:hypothetical protein
MKKIRIFLFALLSLFAFSCEEEGGLTNEQIIQGLKEALRVGTQNSVASTNKTDGYYGNSLIKIPFPQDAQFVMTALNAIPFVGPPVVEELILKVNRAAEDAADEAGPIFLDAITNITISDGLTILQGADDAATQYLKTNTYNPLKQAFKPDIQNSLDQVGASQAWSTVTTTYNNYVPSPQPVNTDLADYTTGKAIDGLFTLIALEEGKIRKDPAARINDILRTVFGN